MDKKPTKALKRYKISFVILLILMAATFYVIFKEFECDKIVGQIRNSSHKFYLLFSCFMALLYLMFYGRFMRISTKAFGEKVSHFKCFIYGCADFFYSAITPSASGGQPAVIYFMSKDGLPYSTSAITVILQAVFFKVVLLFYNILSLIFIRDIIISSGSFFHILLIIGTAFSFITITLCLTSMYRTRFTGLCGRALIRFLSRIHILKNCDKKLETFEKTLSGYKDAAFYIKGKKKMLLHMFFITLMQRTVMFSIAYFVYKSFGLSGFGIVQFLCLQATVALAVDSIPLPGGMGANELAIYFLYGRVYGTDNILAAAAMLLTRGFSYYLTLIISSICTLGKQAAMYFGEKRVN
ncbi:MAG: hypothetical protein CVU97_06065 [Firmicutes bacterium HGW-Firmicutes-21]|nr:MAG: hypothetical protein CVU97_06065 [Firmicutes bacterium HGW-Firmicutes-21]